MSDLRNKLRSTIASISDIKKEILIIKEWDNIKIVVKGMNGKERAELMNKAVDAKTGTVNFTQVYPQVIIACCYTTEDEKLFESGDEAMLEGKSSKIIEMLAAKALELSGITEDASDEIEKN